MRIKSFTICTLASLLLSSSAVGAVKTTASGVVVTMKHDKPCDTQQVRVEVLGDKLFHVTASPTQSFNRNESLIIVPQEGKKPQFKVAKNDTAVVVSTSAVKTYVNKKTGVVTFRDSNGKLILAEQGKDGRSFTPYSADGESAYSARQVWLTDDSESFYGLGQHQADEWNYKGKNEELFQYNTKVSVPFVVSTKNYGILWDSYSLCRFGDPRDYSQLGEVFRLFDKDGKEGALTGTYVPNDNPESGTIVRREDKLYFEHLLRGDLSKVINLPEGFPMMGSNVTFEGEIEPSESGTFRFILYYAGYMKVSIDGKEVVPERWRTAWNPNSYKFAVDLKAGKRVPVKVEWIPDGYVSYCGLRALSPVPDKEQNKLSWWGQMQDNIDYYFVAGDSMDDVISGYRTLTGKSQVMPKWAMGYWQSRERYKTSDELLDALEGFRSRHIPIDNIVLDWSYWPEDKWGSHEFDKARFPDPKAMVDSVHKQNAHIMISVWPKFYDGIEHFKEFDSKGWMYRQAITDSIRDWIGQGYIGSFYDAYSDGARKLFWNQMKEHLMPLGFDAWWMDASEPNVRDCTDIEYRKDLCGPTALGTSDKYFNTYALMNAEAIYDGQRATDHDRRVFLLTRSGFAGLQRYSTATWSGDIATRWEDMKAQISAGLNFAVSGIPYWTMDIGGFCVEDRYVKAQQHFDETGEVNADLKEWRELNARWYQFGAFCPLYRAHGQWPFREVYNLAPESDPCYKSIVYYTDLRYRLMPYIYSLAGMTHFNDYTIMRPLVLDFATDHRTHNVGDQFMFGPSLMVAPVYTYGARSRNMYFPEGCGWYDFYTGRYIAGGQSLTVDAPYERVPLYAREGSIVAFGPVIEYTDQKPADVITLYVFAGKDASFTLYEDEGVNYNYEQGKYAMIPLTYDDASSTLTIGDRQGSFSGMLSTRKFNVVKVSPESPMAVNPDARGIAVTYDGNAKSIKI